MNKAKRIKGEHERARGATERIKGMVDALDVHETFDDWGALRETAAALVGAAAQLQSHAAVLLALDGREPTRETKRPTKRTR
jgi:hypothetical protein